MMCYVHTMKKVGHEACQPTRDSNARRLVHSPPPPAARLFKIQKTSSALREIERVSEFSNFRLWNARTARSRPVDDPLQYSEAEREKESSAKSIDNLLAATCDGGLFGQAPVGAVSDRHSF